MNATPTQTYLDERLQSARCLGWPVTDDKPARASGIWAWLIPHPLLRHVAFWTSRGQ